MHQNRSFRIGLLLPSSNTTMEPDFYKMTPEWITIHTARMNLDEVTPEGLLRMSDDAANAADLLATANVDIIIYGCTTGSLIGGIEWEEDLMQKIINRTGIPTISTSRAVVEALKVLDCKKVGVATPYSKILNELEVEFLKGHGLKVSSIKGLDLLSNLDIGRIKNDIVVKLVDYVAEGADVIFISCTNLPAVDLIDRLEEKLGKAIVTSNQASLWAAIKNLNGNDIKGYGELFAFV